MNVIELMEQDKPVFMISFNEQLLWHCYKNGSPWVDSCEGPHEALERAIAYYVDVERS